jgi:hypothetical protein
MRTCVDNMQRAVSASATGCIRTLSAGALPKQTRRQHPQDLFKWERAGPRYPRNVLTDALFASKAAHGLGQRRPPQGPVDLRCYMQVLQEK